MQRTMDIPIIAQSNETSTTGTVGPPGAVEPGPGGPLVLWTLLAPYVIFMSYLCCGVMLKYRLVEYASQISSYLP